MAKTKAKGESAGFKVNLDDFDNDEAKAAGFAVNKDSGELFMKKPGQLARLATVAEAKEFLAPEETEVVASND